MLGHIPKVTDTKVLLIGTKKEVDRIAEILVQHCLIVYQSKDIKVNEHRATIKRNIYISPREKE